MKRSNRSAQTPPCAASLSTGEVIITKRDCRISIERHCNELDISQSHGKTPLHFLQFLRRFLPPPDITSTHGRFPPTCLCITHSRRLSQSKRNEVFVSESVFTAKDAMLRSFVEYWANANPDHRVRWLSTSRRWPIQPRESKQARMFHLHPYGINVHVNIQGYMTAGLCPASAAAVRGSTNCLLPFCARVSLCRH